MELELGLKITKTRDDLTSTTDFRMAKDPSGPIFMSRETESKFILTAHLKGFGREHIAIKINEDGTQIAVSWEKPIQEMVMSGWMMQKKEVELRGFIRVFRIPDGVVLDRIKAKFNEQESVLTVLMPKSVKGITRAPIEEVKEVIDSGRDDMASTPEVPKSKADKETSKKEKSKRAEEDPNVAKKEESDSIGKERVDEAKSKTPQLELPRKEQDVKSREETGQQQREEGMSTAQKTREDRVTEPPDTTEPKEFKQETQQFPEMTEKNKKQQIPQENNRVFGMLERSDTTDRMKKVVGGEDLEENKDASEEVSQSKRKHSSRKINLCTPCVIAGSSIIVSLVVFAFHWIRSKKREAR